MWIRRGQGPTSVTQVRDRQECHFERRNVTLICLLVSSGVIMSCIVSVLLWAVVIADLTLTTHTEMFLCRPLHDPEYRTVEALLESRGFLEKPLGVSLKELLG